MSATTLGQAVLAITTVFLVLAIVSVILRAWASHVRSRSWRVHDYLIIVALVFAVAQFITVYLQVFQGDLGEHTPNTSPQQISDLFKGFTGNNIAWIFATNLIKLSVLLFYLDIFSIRVAFRRLTYGFVGFVFIYGISCLLCVFTICRPFAATWDKTIRNGRCGNIMNAMFATAIINMVEDLVVVIMPMPILWKLQISSQKKVGMSAIIGVGFIICGINLARLGFAAVDAQADPTHTLAYQVIFMNLEVQIGIINACLPTIKPLFKRKQYASHGKPTYIASRDTRGTTGSEKGPRHSTEKRCFTPDDDHERLYEGKL